MQDRRSIRGAVAASMLLAALPAAHADEGWTGTGELGLAVSSGNSRSENINAKLGLANEDGRWKHSYGISVQRAKGEVLGDFDGDGVLERDKQLTANRYDLSASSAYQSGERSHWVAALRYENDDFAAFESQATFSIGYGRTFVKNERTQFSGEIGPGYRRLQPAGGGDSETDAILRGVLDFGTALTASTRLVNTLLVESGSDNTFAKNDFGVAVAINRSLALKTGLQLRYNSEVAEGVKKTDTLTTVNLVYSFK